MLKLVVLPLIFLASLAHAEDYGKERPEAIKCTSQATIKEVRSFTITQLNTDKPDWSVTDSSLMEPLTSYDVHLGFSNECDNSYEVFIYGRDLANLKQGKLKSIKGLVQYSSVQLDETFGDEQNHEETRVLTCRLLKK